MADRIQEDRTIDQVKVWAPVGLSALAVVVFYALSDSPILLRVLLMVGMILVGVVIFFTSDKGREVASFLQNSRVELRKMVWPTRTETMQTTLIVLVAVIIIALFLWAVDLFLSWFMAMVIQ